MLAAWLTAIKVLRPQSEITSAAIARMIGMELQDTSTETPSASRRAFFSQADEKTVTSASVGPEAFDGKIRQRVESVIHLANADSNPVPAWVAAARLLDPPDKSMPVPVLEMEPLFPARTSRGILSAALSARELIGDLDVDRIVEQIARAEQLNDVPRLELPTLSHGVQLLIDRAVAMQPFALDQALLRAALVSVAGREHTEVLYFDGSPLWGAGHGTEDEWPDYAPPGPGTPVVVLTDVGIGRPPHESGFASASDWIEFGFTVARKRCPLLVLVPYPPLRWPAGLSRHVTMIQWDRPTTTSAVRRMLPHGLRAARAI